MKQITMMILFLASLFAGQALGEIIFTESFEDPDVTNLTDTDPTGWAAVGHPGYQGINDEDSGTFTTPYGSQAVKIYSVATFTTTASILNHNLKADTSYTLSFNIARRNDKTDTGYVVEFLVNNIIVGTVTGTTTQSDMSDSNRIVFKPGAAHTHLLGQPVAIRLKKAPTAPSTSNPQFDNIRLEAVSSLPKGFLLIVE